MTNKTNYIGPLSYEPPLRNVTSLPRTVRAQVASEIRCSGASSQVVGISTDHHLALAGWQKDHGSKPLFLSDFRRQMPPAYGEMQTYDKSPVSRYERRAYFIIDERGATST